jgi:hypothetical protein
MFRGRRQRAIRERGLPARAEVRAVRRRRGRWTVLIGVTAADGRPFETRVRVGALDGTEPRPGDRIDVLHHDGHALPMDQPVRFLPPPSAPDAGHAGRGETAVRPADVIGQVLRGLADGSLLHGGPQIMIDDEPREGTGDGPNATMPELIARASGDPDATGDEILRRVIAGEATFAQVLDATRAAGPEGTTAALAVLRSLRDRGLLGERQHAMLSRMLG